MGCVRSESPWLYSGDDLGSDRVQSPGEVSCTSPGELFGIGHPLPGHFIAAPLEQTHEFDTPPPEPMGPSASTG